MVSLRPSVRGSHSAANVPFQTGAEKQESGDAGNEKQVFGGNPVWDSSCSIRAVNKSLLVNSSQPSFRLTQPHAQSDLDEPHISGPQEGQNIIGYPVEGPI